MPLFAIGSSLTLLAAASAAPITSEVAMFERVALEGGLSFYTVGVFEDSRCPDRELCFRDEHLVVAAVIVDGSRRKGYNFELGVPQRVPGGWLTLLSTTAKPREYGAIPLSEYGLTYIYERDI
ncbi:hypothetical protein [Altererythrobacter sp. Z27]|uniref:hypothetical protein n=1 Tax=Altererythrobacter sp. Z27 TaxID=3461147 RepID=UPI0040449585